MMIAWTDYQLRYAKPNSRADVKGVTVSVPNGIERVFPALRAALTGRPAMQTACPPASAWPAATGTAPTH
jgi:hypothetical protein